MEKAMPSLAPFITPSYCKPVGVAILALVLAGCAQQRPDGYYATPHDSTEADAQQQAQGRTGARAPAQIQLGFGGSQAAKAKADQAAAAEPTVVKARPLAEAKTFLGTLPCLNGNSACSATRVTLTLAPTGEWRSRTVFLDTPTADRNIVEQGCWDVIGTQPLRIMLKLGSDASKGNLTFVNDNVLRVNMINDIRPTLEHRLTRQPDIDGIPEIASQTPLKCD
jgi:hypothetical protein